MQIRNALIIAGLAMLNTATATLAAEAPYPNKSIRWVVPFAPGGGTDMVARPVAAKLTERIGQQILYDNRGGGNGVIAGEIVANATPDGYTLLVAAVAIMTVNLNLMKLPFDPVKDFIPITKLADVPNMLVARAALPVAKVQDVINYAKANPGKLRWATSDPGSAGTLSMHMFRLGAGLDLVVIPYKGAGPASVAVVSGEADLMFANPAVFMPHITAGRLRAIATASTRRLAVLPDMPTFDESGMPGFESISWYGLAAPAHTPQRIVNYQYREVTAVLKQPEVAARITREGGFPAGNTPQEFARDIRSDIAKWAKVIKDANIKL